MNHLGACQVSFDKNNWSHLTFYVLRFALELPLILFLRLTVGRADREHSEV
jgi:hypothetical protein